MSAALLAVAAGKSFAQGGLSVLGAIAQDRALRAQADLERQAASASITMQRQDAGLARRRNELLTQEVEGRVAAAGAARGITSGGSVEDLLRANQISSSLNRALINANVQRQSFETSLNFASRLQDIRNRRTQARLGAIAGVVGAASSFGQAAAGEME